MARRLHGVLVIVQALAPFIVLVSLFIVSVSTTHAISNSADRYRQLVNQEVKSARETFQLANQGFTALSGYVTGVRSAIDAAAVQLAGVAASVLVKLPEVPGFKLPDISIPIPGVREVKQLVNGVASAGKAVGHEIDKITSLAVVPEQLQALASATQVFADEVRSAMTFWVTAVAGIFAFALMVWLLGSLARIGGELRRGWVLLTT